MEAGFIKCQCWIIRGPEFLTGSGRSSTPWEAALGGFLCCPSEILELTYLRHLTPQVEFGSSSLWNLIFSTCVLQEQGIYYTLCLGEPCPTASAEGLSSRIPILADLWKSPVLFLAQLLCSAVMSNFPVHSLCQEGWVASMWAWKWRLLVLWHCTRAVNYSELKFSSGQANLTFELNV